MSAAAAAWAKPKTAPVMAIARAEVRRSTPWRQAEATESRYEVEYRLRTADGAYRWVLARALPFRDSQGRVLRWFGTCTDIEDVKRLEAALLAADRRKNEVSELE